MSTSSSWLVRRAGIVRPFRLYCFAYAGGHAGVFAPWQQELYPHIEVVGVQAPGRGTRIRERPMTSWSEIVREAAHAIANDGSECFAFFGHSLGALLAFEVLRNLVHRGLAAPARLFVSGCEAPRHRVRGKSLHTLPDDQLIEEIRRFNGTPPEVLASAELMQLVLPMLRADFTLAHEYMYREEEPLAVPITIFGGELDSYCNRARTEQWAQETSGGASMHWINGDHFFIRTHQQQLMSHLRHQLSELIFALPSPVAANCSQPVLEIGSTPGQGH